MCTIFGELLGFFHFKKHSSTLTSAGGGLAWPACHFQVEGNSTHLRPWEANARLLSSSAGWEHGRTREEKEGDKAEELESSILSLTPLPRQENQCDSFIYPVFALLPLLLHVENSSLVGVVHCCRPALGTKHWCASLCTGCQWFWHVACVLCRAEPSPLAVSTFWVCQRSLRNREVNPISYLCLPW